MNQVIHPALLNGVVTSANAKITVTIKESRWDKTKRISEQDYLNLKLFLSTLDYLNLF